MNPDEILEEIRKKGELKYGAWVRLVSVPTSWLDEEVFPDGSFEPWVGRLFQVQTVDDYYGVSLVVEMFTVADGDVEVLVEEPTDFRKVRPPVRHRCMSVPLWEAESCLVVVPDFAP